MSKTNTQAGAGNKIVKVNLRPFRSLDGLGDVSGWFLSTLSEVCCSRASAVRGPAKKGGTLDALSVLRSLGSGRTLDELHEALVRTAEEVVETGKPGSVTLTLKLVNKHPGDVMVIVDEKVARQSPKKDPNGAFFFMVDGELHQRDPRQAEMQFRTVDPQTGEIREPEAREKTERMV